MNTTCRHCDFEASRPLPELLEARRRIHETTTGHETIRGDQ